MQMALNILTIPATKADCKQAFSQVVDLLEPRRSLISVIMLAAICCVRSWLAEGFEKVKTEHSECDSVANITRLLTMHAEDIIAGSRPPTSKAPSPLRTETTAEPSSALPASLRNYSIQIMDMDKDMEEDIEENIEDTGLWPK